MAIYKCPVCDSISVSWDARARVYLCNVLRCSSWFAPPHEDGLNQTDMAYAISRGDLVILQEWLDQQQPCDRPAISQMHAMSGK